MTMYNSLKSFTSVPIQVLPFVSKDGAGDMTYGLPINKTCSVHGEIKVVRDLDGVEHVSNLQLYIDGRISPEDKIIFEGKEYVIKSTGPYYNDKGLVDLTVVYL